MKANNKVLLTLMLLGGIGLAGCGSDDDDDMHDSVEMSHSKPALKTTPDTHKPSAEKHATHWSYEGDGAPHAWGVLKNEFGTCSQGKQQSPIDITAVSMSSLPSLELNYKSSPLEIINNGHTVQVNYKAGSSLTVGDKKYDLLQFHFHSPSEHTVGGKSYAMVAHLVHKAADGQLGVIGVLMKEGRSNPLVEQIWKSMPKTAGARTQLAASVNVTQFLPKDLTYFNYSGSLTTPPCSEGVNWMVLASPIEVSKAQVAAFTQLFPLSVRPVQPLNGRVVKASN